MQQTRQACNIIRKSHTNSLDNHTEDGSYTNDGFLGVHDLPFDFEHIVHHIGFVETVFQVSLDKSPIILGTDKLTSWVVDQLY
ncbi:hypothetical protein BB561_002651 [Smittium simulii]|uniref:Uncharacterized protein n=1 Tax=Smittium simulii TaxID=133385 RepID=A0A2T9YPQ4_9FUNG|nr:hypothetical protein BB561_002651 [Smittium simulii]